MNYKNVFVTVLLAYVALITVSVSHANMLISPTRVYLDADNRSATLTLKNTSEGPRTYKLLWEEKRATEKGGYTDVSEGEEWPSASNLVRFSPRQITVGAGENQTVRFSFRPPADLPTGEYRSHLLLQVLPEISEPTATLNQEGPSENVGVQVFMQMSFSIPVVVRNNTDVPEVSLAGIKAVPSASGKSLALELTLDREGDASSFGNVVVEMQRDSDSPVEVIGRYKELSIYSELNKRKLVVPLKYGSIPSGAVLRVAYSGDREYKGLLWAEKVFRTQ